MKSPNTPPDLACVYVTNRTAAKYVAYVESLPVGTVRFVLGVAPRKNMKKFPHECPENTIALLEMNDGECHVVTAREAPQKPMLVERPGVGRVKP
jgi:hypothetical protein